jgi:hypothetical protein
MQQQRTSLLKHIILEAGMPPFFLLGAKHEISENPPISSNQSSKRKLLHRNLQEINI